MLILVCLLYHLPPLLSFCESTCPHLSLTAGVGIPIHHKLCSTFIPPHTVPLLNFILTPVATTILSAMLCHAASHYPLLGFNGEHPHVE